MCPVTEARFELGHVAHYALVELLGNGAHGSTYLARSDLGEGRVAVKVLAQQLRAEQFQAVSRLLRLTAGLDGQVRFFEAGRRDDGTVFLAMQHHALGSLGSPPRQLSDGEVVRVIADAARAAHQLHEVGLTHGAIRPSNILLGETGACLAEIDLTQAISPGMSLQGRASASALQYLEPTLLRGGPAARATDIWALGVALHVALTGKPVLSHAPDTHRSAHVRAHLEEAPHVDPGLAPVYSDIVRACLAADRADRPATAAELAHQLDLLVPPAVGHSPFLATQTTDGSLATGREAHGAPGAGGSVMPPQYAGASYEAVPLTSTSAEAAAGRDALPVLRREGAPQVAHVPLGAPEVDGVLCNRGHFNDVQVRYCHVCGMSMLEAERNVVRGPRPAVGVLILDDGSAFHLDMDYVIGADPHRESGCQEGRARALVLQDASGAIAPVHAVIRLSDWNAVLVDRGSSSGTRVSETAMSSARDLQPGEELTLLSHTTISAGGRKVTFYSHHQR
ncbi:MAG: hypothetical protein NVS3B24_14610 [Candidatus Dormibacteria bacterium]